MSTRAAASAASRMGLVLCGLLAVPSGIRAQGVLTQAPGSFRSLRAWLVGSTESGDTVDMPLVDEQLTVDIDAQQATTRLQQTYHNPSSVNVEGLYTLEAGLGAKAEGFAYWNGEEKIVGEVFERQVARRVYESVVRRSRDPGLLEEKRDGTFSFQVSPIQPNERKRVEVTYGQWLPRRATAVEYRAPVARRTTDITVTVADGRELFNFESPTHFIEARRLSGGRVLVRARQPRKETPVFVLRYEINDKPWTVAGYLHRERGRDAHFAVTLAAPRLPASAVVPKDVTLVLDRSGSMAGEMIRQARAACMDVVRRLAPHDRVNVIAFDSDVEKLYDTPRAATDEVRRQATDYVDMVREGGGTNIAKALAAALDAQDDGTNGVAKDPAAGQRPRVVLFFTDGRSDAAPAIKAAADDKRDVRVFTVGFGSEVDRPFLSRLAASKRGRFTYIPAAADIEHDVGALYQQIGAPLLVDLKLEVSGATAAEVYPRTLPDLFADDEIRVGGRLRGERAVTFTLSGRERGGKAVSYRTVVNMPEEGRQRWVGRLWAQARVDDLLQEMAVGGEQEAVKREVVDLALAYNFATPYTSFLAIPASELDPAAAHQLASARDYKERVLRRRPEAVRAGDGTAIASAEGTNTGAGRGGRPGTAAPGSGSGSIDDLLSGSSSSGRSSGQRPRSAPAEARPPAQAKPDSQPKAKTVYDFEDAPADEAGELARPDGEMVSSAKEPRVAMAPRSKKGHADEENDAEDESSAARPGTLQQLGANKPRKGGCAHCAVSDSAESTLSSVALMALLGLLALRLRRRGS